MTPEELQTTTEALEALIQSGTDFEKADAQARELLNYISIGEGRSEVNYDIHCRILLALAESLWQRGLAKEALSFSEQAVATAEKAQSKELEAKAIGNIGIVYKEIADYPKALEYHSRALAIDEELGNKQGMARHIGNIGIVYKNLSDYPKTLEYYSRALAINEELGNKPGMAANIGNIGGLYKELSDYPKALEYYSRALAINEELGNKQGVARHTGNIGIVLKDISDYPKALEYMSRALAIDEELGNKAGVAGNSGNIGNVYRALSDYPKALEYMSRTLAICEELGNKAGVAASTGNIGNVYTYLLDYPKALEYYSRALTINEELGNKTSAALWLGNIGNVYTYLLDYPKALEYLSRALAINEELGNKRGVAASSGSIGVVYSNKVFEGYNSAKAEEYLLKAMAISTEIGAKSLLLDQYKYLADIYEQECRVADAFLYYKKYVEIEKDINIEETKKQEAIREQRKAIELAKAAADARHQATQELLHNVLPPSIAHRMVEGEKLIAEKLPSVSVLFADIVGFTKLSQQITAEELVEGLDRIFSSFDTLAEKHGLEKIKTIGDAYMVVSGAPEPRADHAEAMAHFALDMLEAMKEFTSKNTSEKIQLRIGIHSGEVVAGVIGKKKFAYDLWGDAVNTASRMESHGEAGKIHISDDFRTAVETCRGTSLHTIVFIERGEMDIKGKGKMKTYFLERSDGNG